MTTPEHLLERVRPPLRFLVPDPRDLQEAFAAAVALLPPLQRIFLEDESATPLLGFPVLETAELNALEAALETFILSEERVQIAQIERDSFDPSEHEEAWRSYRDLLVLATENASLSSFGRSYPEILWLVHSTAVARAIEGIPKRVIQASTAVGREHGPAIKYRVLNRWFDRVLKVTYDTIQKLAEDTGEPEEQLFPQLLRLMGDNVLVLSETHVSSDLGELGAYLGGQLGIDAGEFRLRLGTLQEWHETVFSQDSQLRSAAAAICGDMGRTEEPNVLLRHARYLDYVLGLPEYDEEHLLPPPLAEIWKELLRHLKQFELIETMRHQIVRTREVDGQYVANDPRTRGTGLGRREVALSYTTRPLDFWTPWVVDPKVGRLGLLYDISDFSDTLSKPSYSAPDQQERLFRMMFRFQRRVNQIAFAHRLKLEKYLGDGAFYSGIHPHRLLLVAIQIQRLYTQMLDEGFPFDSGIRMALNYGRYRMLPIQSGQVTESERYEFFGAGIVELDRLVTGKSGHSIDEVKRLLLNLGYPADTVDRFFAPLARRNIDIVDQRDEVRPFFAYINQNGTLINAGIVATHPFVEQLARQDEFGALHVIRDGDRPYLVLTVADAGTSLDVGIRRLGTADLKGLERLLVYEVVDGLEWDELAWRKLEHRDLLAAVTAELTPHKVDQSVPRTDA